MNRQIDSMLRDWAERQRPDEAARQQLESRILQAAHRSSSDDAHQPGIIHNRMRAEPATQNSHHEVHEGHEGVIDSANKLRILRGETTWFLSACKALTLARGYRVLWFAAGVAATLLVAGIWHGLVPEADSLPALLRHESGLFAARRSPMSRIFCETERLFGSKLQWVALSGGDAELGLADHSAEGEPLVVRVVVVSRPIGTIAWERLWEAEVVARANGILELVPDGRPDNHLALWLYRLEDGSALVESRLTLRTPVVMKTETSEILTFGATHKVSRLQQGGVEYLLLQTVAPVVKGPSCTS